MTPWSGISRCKFCAIYMRNNSYNRTCPVNSDNILEIREKFVRNQLTSEGITEHAVKTHVLQLSRTNVSQKP